MRVFSAVIACSFLGACSSIVSGTNETLTVNSNPAGANCALVRNGLNIGNVTTPGGVIVQKTKHNITMTCSKDGYDDSVVFLKSGVEGATFGNLVLGGAVGWAIDSADGADNHYPEVTTVYLNRKGVAPQTIPATPPAPAPKSGPSATDPNAKPSI